MIISPLIPLLNSRFKASLANYTSFININTWGILHVTQGSLGHELSLRKPASIGATRPLLKRIFANPRLPRQTRRLTYHSYVLSIGLYGCGTWPSLNLLETALLNKRLMPTYRSIYHAGTPGPERARVSDHSTTNDLERLTPSHVVLLRRLKLGQRILKSLHTHLLAVILTQVDDARSWVSVLLSNFNAPFRQIHAYQHYCDVDPKDTLHIRAAVSAATWKRIKVLLIIEVQQNTHHDAPLNIARPYHCDPCPKTFVTQRALFTHQWDDHKIPSNLSTRTLPSG